jgi:membrane-associated phospholipid phosphatase
MHVCRKIQPHVVNVTTAARNTEVIDLPRSVWLIALAITLLGLGIHISGVNVAWFVLAHAHPFFPDFFWSNATLLGFGWAVLIVITAFDRVHGRWAVTALLAVVFGGLFFAFIKRIAYHPRPFVLLNDSHLQMIGEPILRSGSMPSGHAAGAAVMITLLVLALRERGQLDKTRLYVLVLAAFLVAWSRVAIGAHWPADVMVGAPLGMALAMGAYRLVHVWMPHKPVSSFAQDKHRRWWLCTLELALAAICWGTDTGQPQAVLFQGFLGSMAIVSCLARLRPVMGLAFK